jgi:hypothetical protein
MFRLYLFISFLTFVLENKVAEFTHLLILQYNRTNNKGEHCDYEPWFIDFWLDILIKFSHNTLANFHNVLI